MSVAAILAIIAALVPYIPGGITDFNAIVARIKGGESLDTLIAEFEAKRDDLENLDFGQTNP